MHKSLQIAPKLQEQNILPIFTFHDAKSDKNPKTVDMTYTKGKINILLYLIKI